MNQKLVMLLGLVMVVLAACGGNAVAPEEVVAEIPESNVEDLPEPEVVISTESEVENSEPEDVETPEEVIDATEVPTATEPPAPTEVPTEMPTHTPEPAPTVATIHNFQLDGWADNWFAFYLEDQLILEDSVSITTERSFNSETVTFSAAYPLQLNFVLKDYKENDTGLEYIGSNRQQMGDGGFIMQLTDTDTGALVAVTSSAFTCKVINTAPLDKSCESASDPVAGSAPCGFDDQPEPDGWKAADFDDSSWTDTTIHSATAVDPKIGYDDINWDPSAEFVWGPDLETNNTILCRLTVTAQN